MPHNNDMIPLHIRRRFDIALSSPNSARPDSSCGLPPQGPCAAGAERGASSLTTLVFGVLLAAVLYVAYHVLPFYYYYLEMTNHMYEAVRVASQYSDKELREKLEFQMKWMQIPADPSDLQIERFGDTIRISLPYEEVFTIPWGDDEWEVHRFEFYAVAEGRIINER